MNLFRASLLALMTLILAVAASDANESAAQKLARADRLRLEGSFAQAREVYDALADSTSKDIRDAANVWGADCLWRERAGGENTEAARKRLERAVEDLPKDQSLRAEAAESLGDLLQQNRPWDQWDKIVEVLASARDFWGSSSDPGAVARYVKLNFKIADFMINRIGYPSPRRPRPLRTALPPKPDTHVFDLIRDSMRNVLRVSQDATDRTHALLNLGRACDRSRHYIQDKAEQAARMKEAEDYFRQASAIRPNNEWSDDALWETGQFFDGAQNYVEAVRAWNELLERYKPGQTQFYDNARNMVRNTTEPTVGVNTAPSFAPGSYIHVSINYRNLKQATLTLKRANLESYLEKHQFSHRQGIADIGSKQILEKQVEGMIDEGKFVPHSTELYLDPLEPAVYQITLTSPKVTNPVLSQPFLVGALGVAGKFDRDKAELFVTNSDTGVPAGNIPVSIFVWEGSGAKSEPEHWLSADGKTGSDGRATVDMPRLDPDRPHDFYAVARRGDEIALFQNWGYWAGRYGGHGPIQAGIDQPTVLYAYTDRPAYRPDEPIHWKAVLRTDSGEAYDIPKTSEYKLRIRDERSNVAHEATYKVSEFGTMEGTFTASRSVALGMLQIEIDLPTQQRMVAAQLCRLEEYKLPEFKVSVEPGKGSYRLGSAVPFTIQAEYYFGGPVAGATAQVVVHRAPFWPWWSPIRPYDWLYEGAEPMDYVGGFGGRRSYRAYSPMGWGRPYAPEQIVLQKTVTLDANGKANLEVGALTDEEVKAARDQHVWGYSYRVEARVTDLSRREVSASGSVKVALTAFAAYLYPQRYLYLPGDAVKIDISTLDPNNKPVAAEGLVTVYKREWDKDRKDAQGNPAPGYKDTELFNKPAVTGADGRMTLQFQPDQNGFFYIKYNSHDSFGEKVEGETTVFVASKDTTSIGYRSGGAEIIIDRTTYEQGDTIQALIVTRRPGVSVWLAAEAEAVLSSQIINMKGTAQLVPIKVDPSFTPNVYLTTVSMYDFSGFRDVKMVRVPPVDELLNVKIISDKAEYRPGEKADVRVEVRDHSGKPVRAELSLGVADASVWAIQSDVAPDARKFFWGRTRPLAIQTLASPDSYRTEFWAPKKDEPGKFERVMREEIPAQAMDESKLAGAYYDRRHGLMDARGGLQMEITNGLVAPASAPMVGGMGGMDMKVRAAKSPVRNYSAGQPAETAAEPRVRTNFASTAYWMASVVTDRSGTARATFTMPDSLTTWRATSLALTQSTQIGQETREVKTNKPIMVRPQVPRFFVQGDKATLSAIITNNTSETQKVRVRLETKGLRVNEILAGIAIEQINPAWTDSITSPVVLTNQRAANIVVPANNQRRVDWVDVMAETTGAATVKMSALATIDSDAAEKTYPILEYGIEQFIAKAAAIREAAGETSRTLTLSIPADRRAGSEGLTIWIEPTLARAMVNALPYLADYPYGCVEQTLSRFVPAVITYKTLQQLQIKNPKLEKKLPDMIKAGLDRLYDMQGGDGGWGWWKEGKSDPYMTAYVVQGLAQAREADVNVRTEVITRAAQFLRLHLVDFEDQPDMEAWMLYALATVRDLVQEDQLTDAAHQRLWPRREELNPYARALYALACHKSGRTERAQTLARNMMNDLVEDKPNGTAHWGSERFWWRWSDGAIEATAFGLRALLAIDPQNPVIDEAMTWLVRNRRGSRWESTKDTAIVIRALADYIKIKGEDKPDWTADVIVNGTHVKSLEATPQNVFEFEGKVIVPANLLKTGDNEIKIVRKGTGVLYASAWLTYFTREEKIKPAGNEVFAERRYFRTEMKPTPSGVYKPVRTELKEGDVLNSGDRVEVELSLEAKNNYEYIVIEDMKAAGMEPVQLQSGGVGGQGIWGHQELRDEKTAFFVDNMPQGKHTLKYELRAEIPGTFHALPCLVHAMYVPEIRANSSNDVIQIK
ncbi:hypothetical protein LLG95_04625 [bacterium]|nr:hypothetical protein [bacterium]